LQFRRPHTSTLFPYTTLFRSLNPGSQDSAYVQGLFNSNADITLSWTQIGTFEAAIGTEGVITNDAAMNRAGTTISDDQFTFEFRSEEHTSELQSRENLVCRLL